MEIKKYDWVDALRGYAILLVVMIHTSQLFLDKTFHLNGLTKIGDLGVTLFFIASSFTLFNSYRSRKVIEGSQTNKFFFIRRFFRIAPLYYLAIIFYSIVYSLHAPKGFAMPINFFNIIANLTFLNGVYLPAINYIPPGGWSVGDEMLFYLTIPFLFSKINSLNKAFQFLLFCIIISFLIQIACYVVVTNYTHHSWLALRGWHLYFWFPNQFPVFCFGICLFFIIDTAKVKYKEWMLFSSILLLMLLSFINYQITFPQFLFQREYLYSFAFCCLAFSLSQTRIKFFIKPINELGKVSFSIYLVHFVIINIVGKLLKSVFQDKLNNDITFIIGYALVIIITYLIAKFTYGFIEKKGIAYGEHLIEKIKKTKNKVSSPIHDANLQNW